MINITVWRRKSQHNLITPNWNDSVGRNKLFKDSKERLSVRHWTILFEKFCYPARLIAQFWKVCDLSQRGTPRQRHTTSHTEHDPASLSRWTRSPDVRVPIISHSSLQSCFRNHSHGKENFSTFPLSLGVIQG